MKIKSNKLDIAINALCIIMLIGITVYLIVNWKNIPEKVPMHHNFAGEIDRWGNKTEMLVLPVITMLMFLFLTAIEHFPQIWNTGVKITVENMEYVYRTLKNMIITLKFIVVCIFTYLTIETSMGTKLCAWFLLFALVTLFGDMLFWMFRLKRINRI